MPEVSVIVPTYNKKGSLLRVLHALAAQSFTSFEVIVCDDGSSDGTEEAVAPFSQKNRSDLPYPFKYTKQEDRGYRLSAVRNRGIQAAEGEYLIFLDADCIPTSQFIAAHVEALKSSPKHISTGPVLPYSSLSQKSSELCKLLQTYDPRPWPDLPPAVAENVWGGNMGVARREALLVGGFDESFEAWGAEDADFAARLFFWGATVRGALSAVVYHLEHPKNSDRRGQRIFYSRLSEGTYNNKTALQRIWTDCFNLPSDSPERRACGDTSLEAGRGSFQLGWYEEAAKLISADAKTRLGTSTAGVLDFGAGLGEGTSVLLCAGLRAAALDADTRLAAYWRERGVPVAERRTYQYAVALDVLEHLPKKNLSIFRDYLLQLGLYGVFVTTPNLEVTKCANPYHYFELSPKEWISLWEETLNPSPFVQHKICWLSGSSSGDTVQSFSCASDFLSYTRLAPPLLREHLGVWLCLV